MRRVAIVHEWFTTLAGSEKVVEQLCLLYPDADLFAVVADPDFVERTDFLKGRKLTTSFIQQLPRALRSFRAYLSLMPLAVEQFDLSEYDLVISSSHAVAKGVITGPSQLHVSYVHSPMRYAWDLQHQYLRESGLHKGVKGWVAKSMLHQMRLWDTRTASGVDHFVANSRYIARRIHKVYGRSADVIYPPVDVTTFDVGSNKEPFYFTASRMVPYKRIDLIVEAFSQMPDKRLVVVGDGPEMDKIRDCAAPNVELLGYRPTDELKGWMQRARAFVFAAEEDFGIIPVEAQACGTPVIAYGRGGARETVRGLDQPKPTGVFFQRQHVTDVIEAVQKFERQPAAFSPSDCREQALRFSVERFREEVARYIDDHWTAFREAS